MGPYPNFCHCAMVTRSVPHMADKSCLATFEQLDKDPSTSLQLVGTCILPLVVTAKSFACVRVFLRE